MQRFKFDHFWNLMFFCKMNDVVMWFFLSTHIGLIIFLFFYSIRIITGTWLAIYNLTLATSCLVKHHYAMGLVSNGHRRLFQIDFESTWLRYDNFKFNFGLNLNLFYSMFLLHLNAKIDSIQFRSTFLTSIDPFWAKK